MIIRTAICALAILAFSPAAQAQVANGMAEDPGPHQGTFTALLENDIFAGTDREYTNGVRLGYLSGPKQPDAFARILAARVDNGTGSAVVRRGWAVGQSIFTPEDIDVEGPLPDQHPYAGYLYGEFATLIEQRNQIDVITFEIGLVGPSSGAEWVQNTIHNINGGDEAQGWDNQIDDEIGVTISYDRQLRGVMAADFRDFEFDLTPAAGVSVGTIRTNAKAGVTARFGRDLRTDFGPPRVRPTLAGAGFFRPDGFNWYVFGGVEGRAVAHEIFRDGSLFRDDDPSVDSNTFIAEMQAGVVAQFRDIQLAYTYVQRSETFKEQSQPQSFGALSLSWKH